AEGSRVKAGQSLGTIDLSDLQSRAAERSAGVDSAQARVAEAERIHQSNIDLANQKFISTNALESSRASLESARAALKSAQAQLATSALGIREAALVAPISGVVGRRNVVPGEKVSAEQELMTVVDLKELELAGVVGTHQISMLRPGQKLDVRVEGAATKVEGRIDRIAPMAEAGTRGIRVVVLLPNPDEVFRAGQYASAVVSLDDAAQRLTVPVASVGQASGQDFVWTVEKGALVRRIVITGRRDTVSGRVEVRQGLSADTQVLAARFDTLKEGAPARIVAKGAASGTPAASASSASAKSS
ncbi:MAG TPA: efflux RND transporter periplasmic adaptor subunit, partial [Burkholderiaceae bacterium]|nr:efflux RND transporter periplasmic adaptor subunit [Burkholderiaceae bacterium]